jgi:hypothetical protein
MEKTHKEKLLEAGVRRHGSEKKWREFMRVSGAKADRTTPRGFQVMDKELVREISRNAVKIRWEKQKAAEKEIADNDFITKV